MKYLAILRDCLREAIDTKVIYVMVGLSLLVTFIVFTMSFKPLPAEILMRQLVQGHVSGLDDFNNPQRRRQQEIQQREAMQEQEKALNQPPKPGRKFDPKDVKLSQSLFQFQGVQPLKGPADSPDSEYLVTFRVTLSPEAAAHVKAHAEPFLKSLNERFAGVEKLELLKIAEVRLAGKNNPYLSKDTSAERVYFELVTQPTATTRRLWPHEPSLFFGALPLGGNVPLGVQLFIIATVVLEVGSWVTVLVSVIITAFFIPNMLRKGTVDLLLVKPINRWALLLYKYIGGLTFIFLNTTVAVVGIWFALGLRSGIWANGFLLMIFIITFYFAILYAVSTLFAVLTRSAIVAILMTCGAWFLFFVVGTIYQVFDGQEKTEEALNTPAEQRWSHNTFGEVVRAVHFILPRTSDLGVLRQQLLLGDFLTGSLSQGQNLAKSSITWSESLTVSLVFIALMLGLSSWRFAVRDY
jgi:ABC-type transport system involved in multi-copper enzyme maturation permease subunit